MNDAAANQHLLMQRFRNLGLIETSAEHFLISKEKKLTQYLAQIRSRKPGAGALASEIIIFKIVQY